MSEETIFTPDMVLIDVDGTLVDSVPDLAWCVDETMKVCGMPVRGESAVREWVGNGVQRLVERALTNDLNGTPDAEAFECAMPVFMALYAENTSKRSCLYDGVSEGLDYLASVDGLKVGCVTNKAAQFTHPLLKDMGIFDRFEIVISGDTLTEKKPHPLPLLHAAEQLGVKPENSLMLGDSKSDVKAARAAGFQIICMSYGYNHGEDIRNYQPDAVIDSMTALADLVKSRV
uniref:Phosphoglycolate phosphatase n=1 Tax=uncultured Thiotrichaceae bacterium TaxID=298394 RepID=A0A6S6U3M2_9GAMM|nr:MAG: Phosphoglycolate phosphatase (EC [uncultured Thiotrichaceae bacterium]